MSATASSGVTSNALATALRASRRVKVDPSRVTGMARVGLPVRASVLVDLPVVERHPFSPARTWKDRLDLARVRVSTAVVAEGGGDVVDRGRPGAPVAVGKLDRRRAAPSSLRAAASPASCRRLALPGGEAAISAALADELTPLLHRRLDVRPALGERPQDGLRDVSQLAQAVAPDLPGETERGQFGPQRRLVQGSGGLLPQVEVAAVGGRPPAVGALDQVGDDHVGVELGVAGPAGAVPEGGADEAVGLDELLRRRPRRAKQASSDRWSSTATTARS